MRLGKNSRHHQRRGRGECRSVRFTSHTAESALLSPHRGSRGLNPYIGVDFDGAASFTQNNQRNIAGYNTRTSHPAIAELGKVQYDNFAPCDSLMLHLAISRYRTLPLLPIAPCDSKRPILAP